MKKIRGEGKINIPVARVTKVRLNYNFDPAQNKLNMGMVSGQYSIKNLFDYEPFDLVAAQSERENSRAIITAFRRNMACYDSSFRVSYPA